MTHGPFSFHAQRPLCLPTFLTLILAFSVLAVPPAPFTPFTSRAEAALAPQKSGDDDPGSPDVPPPPVKNLKIPADLDIKRGDVLRELIDDFRRAEGVGTSGDAMKDMANRFKRATARVDIPLTYYYLGRSYHYLRDFESAKKALKRAIKGNDKFYEAYAELAAVDFRQHDYAESQANCEKALAIYPHYAPALETSARALARAGKMDEAYARILRAFEIDANDSRERLLAEIEENRGGPKFEQTFVAETDNYIIRTDVSQKAADQVARSAEQAWSLYQRSFPSLERGDAKFQINLHGNPAGADAVADDEGHYSRLFRTVKLVENHRYEDTEVALKRQAFVQAVSAGSDEIPIWLLEGGKAYYTLAVLDLAKDPDFWVRPPKMEHLNVAGFIRSGKVPPLRALTLMNEEEFLADQRFSSYAWSVVYFCLMSGKKPYQRSLDTYVKALTKGLTPMAAYDASFGKIPERRFVSDWKKYIMNDLPAMTR